MEEKRAIGRITYETPAVIVVCDTQEKIMVNVNNVSPKGMGSVVQENVPGILNKDIIIVADTLMMYAVIKRLEEREDGQYDVGIEAKSFSPEVLQYLFEHIG